MSSTATAAVPAPLRADASTIGLVSVAHGISHFCQLIVPPMFPWLGAEFGLSNTQLGLLLSVFFVVSCIGQALAGFVVDRFGAERVLLGGMSCLAAAALSLALAPSYAALLAAMALAGLGNCVFHPVDYSILNARVSNPRLGHAYAAHGISGSLGWALAPLFMVGVTHASGSWRLAFGAAAATIVVVLALLWLRRESLAVPRRAPASPAGAPEGSFAFLKLPAVWSCFAFFLTSAVALSGVQSFAPQAAAALHAVPAAQVALCVSIFMAASAGGMLLGGHLVRDPRRSARVVAGGFGLSAVVALAIGLGSWPALAVPVLFGLMGFGAGIAGPSRDLLVKQATPEGATGRVYGVVYSGLDVGMTVAPLVFGLLMDGGHHRMVWIGVALTQGLLIANAFNVKAQGRKPARGLAPA